jgi:hypothetical protein
MAELRAVAEEHAERPLLFSGNSCLPYPPHLTDYQSLTHFTSEVGHKPETGLDESNTGAVVAYHIATALKRPLLTTSYGEDWAFINAHQRPELVRAWIAQAYAFGQFFMAPHHQWCHTAELGTHWYDGTAEDYAAIYRFIREHPFLFDGKESAAEVAVVYSTGDAATQRWEGPTWDAVQELLKARVPFDLLVAGDDCVPAQLTLQEAKGYRKVIVAPELCLDAAQQYVIDQLRNEDRLLVWSGASTLTALPASPITVTGPAQLWISQRREPNGGSTVVHLLNRCYDAVSDRMLPIGPITLSVKRALCGPKDREVLLHTPGADALPLEVSDQGERVSVHVPSVSLWGIIQLGR